jgi:hypothetical protein
MPALANLHVTSSRCRRSSFGCGMHVRLDGISATGGWFYLGSDRAEGTVGSADASSVFPDLWGLYTELD